VVDLGRQLAVALDVAHAASVVHGDVKPENVLVAGADPLTVKLGDFGVARLVDATAARTSSRFGTPTYMAPELVTGDPVGQASDVYSLGVLLYEALAGRPPFVAERPIALWKAHADEAPARPDAISDAWWRLLSRMLAKNATDRPTAAGVAAGLPAGHAEPDLTRIGSFETTGEPTLLPTGEATLIKDRAARTPPPAPPRAGRRRRGALAVGGVAAGVVLVTLGTVAVANGWLPANAAKNDRPSVATGTPGAGRPVALPATPAPSATSPAAGPSVAAPGPAVQVTTRVTVVNQPEGNPAPAAATTRPAAVATTPPAKAAKPPADTTAACRAASHQGGLDIGPGLDNSGGPNYVPSPCRAIWLQLTEVYYITHAKACLESGDGTDTRCGSWVYLEDGGAWNKLLDGVAPGARWQLYLKAEGQGHVGFAFSG